MKQTKLNENQFLSLIEKTEITQIDGNDSSSSNDNQISSPSKSKTYNIDKISSLNELLDIIVMELNFPAACYELYAHKFWNCESCNAEEYKEIMSERLNCFSQQDQSPIVSDIHKVLDVLDPIEPRDLLLQTADELSKSGKIKKHGCAGLFLLGHIFIRRPDLITPENLNFSDLQRQKFAPIVAWIAGQAIRYGTIAHLDPLLSTQLLNIFLPHVSSFPIILCASHLISEAFSIQKMWRVSSQHYSRIISLNSLFSPSQNSNSLRNQIYDIFQSFLSKLVVSDKKELASQLFAEFPNAPNIACKVFVKECEDKGNATFLDGWAETHSKNENFHQISMKYLRKVAPQIEERLLHRFPLKDLLEASETTELIARKWELMNSSFRLLFLLGVLIAIYFLKKRFNLF